jgi:hypothetical protein
MPTWINEVAALPNQRKRDYIVTSIRLVTEHGYDKVTLWSRGANCGTLTLKEGDGMEFINRLTCNMEPPHDWRREEE